MAKPKEVFIENEDELFHFIDINTINSERITAPRYSYWRSVGRVFFKKKVNWVMLGILALIILCTIFMPMIYPYDATEFTLVEAAKRLSPSAAIKYHGFSLKWILGSGEYGNSIFAGIWAGSRTSLSLSVICAAINMTIGILLGAVWGYSKKLDLILNFLYNIVANVPYILLISVLVYVIGAGFWSFIFALTITGWLGIAYFFRTQVLIIRNREYNLASKCLGTPITRIVTRNILPFLTSVIVTILATELPSYISAEVYLSYIGVGLTASIPSLGRMVSDAQSSFLTYPWAFWAPTAIASIITIVLYVLGQNLADASDPRTHR
jgi:oligopeptide transport system permease protein